MIVGIVCPSCGTFTDETHEHPQKQPCFTCRFCELILEPPNGMRDFTQTSPLPPGE